MFYHIYIEFFPGEDKKQQKEDCYEINMQSLERIKKYFVKPFDEGKKIFISGRVIRPGSINIFRILETEKPIDQLVSECNNSIPANVLMWYTTEDLLAGHFNGIRDITNEVMNGEM